MSISRKIDSYSINYNDNNNNNNMHVHSSPKEVDNDFIQFFWWHQDMMGPFDKIRLTLGRGQWPRGFRI